MVDWINRSFRQGINDVPTGSLCSRPMFAKGMNIFHRKKLAELDMLASRVGSSFLTSLIILLSLPILFLLH